MQLNLTQLLTKSSFCTEKRQFKDKKEKPRKKTKESIYRNRFINENHLSM